ncbi:nucleic acid-binding protein [Perilla frutescens var. hirtella]|nr:nucleic acid-binding protein [Perilla frutescens var. frutescens]KAH6775651.1 nucleic acid-binding protein [Perilla frutescens var. hirtella]
MGKKSPEIETGAAPSKRRGRGHHKSDSESEPDPDSDSEHGSRKRAKRHSKTRSSSSKRRRHRDTDSNTSSSDSDDDSHDSDSENKRPEFTAWLLEVKQVNMESLANWEEKQLFKDFMEDHNTATFPSKKYYSLDAHFKRRMEKEMKKGFAKVVQSERTVFNDEEQRRLELQQEREKLKEEQVQALQQSMQSGMAQAMKEQAQLREEMAYQYKLGNFEAAAAIQRRLDPDVPM